MSPADHVDKLYQLAANTIGGAASSNTSQHVAQAGQALHAFAEYGDKISLGLLPFAIVLLILHENYEAATAGRSFRLGYLFIRIGVLVAMINPFGYGLLCALITKAAGGHSGWLTSD